MINLLPGHTVLKKEFSDGAHFLTRLYPPKRKFIPGIENVFVIYLV